MGKIDMVEINKLLEDNKRLIELSSTNLEHIKKLFDTNQRLIDSTIEQLNSIQPKHDIISPLEESTSALIESCKIFKEKVRNLNVQLHQSYTQRTPPQGYYTINTPRGRTKGGFSR